MSKEEVKAEIVKALNDVGGDFTISALENGKSLVQLGLDSFDTVCIFAHFDYLAETKGFEFNLESINLNISGIKLVDKVHKAICYH